MLIGEYIHTLDPKKRIALPAKFRHELGKTVVIASWFDKCLVVHTPKEWEAIAEKLRTLPQGQASVRRLSRFILAGAFETEVDSLGRILIPDLLKEFASLESEVVIAGVYTRLELWNKTAWQAEKESVRGDADALAEKLGEIGAF